jgi:hypothetical protein
MDGDRAADEPHSVWMSFGLGLQACTELSRQKFVATAVNPERDNRPVGRSRRPTDQGTSILHRLVDGHFMVNTSS